MERMIISGYGSRLGVDLVDRKDRRMGDWKDGRLGGWRLEGWKNGRLEEWEVGDWNMGNSLRINLIDGKSATEARRQHKEEDSIKSFQFTKIPEGN